METNYPFSTLRLVTACAAAVLFIALLPAQTDSVPEVDRVATRFEEVKERLQLTPEQVDRARPVVERELQQLRDALRGFDRNSASMREKRNVARKVKSIRDSADKQWKDILSPAQFDELKRMRERRTQGRVHVHCIQRAWRFVVDTGELVGTLDAIDLASVSGVADARPWSASSIAYGPRSQPAPIGSAHTTSTAWVVCVGLAERSIIWAERVGDDS